ncbi:MAG TPA: NAD(P)H-dependent glycerol-3-phosphate dehydrogenase [Acetobacteraceae bacterium]|nr:NAD(P)H-dependent glycerol-3-phosphate dehydrogenase [Acetobacteraceae bacterium]
MNDVTVIGAGAWGTTLAIQAVRAGARVQLWARDPARAAELARQRANPRLPNARLPDAVTVIDDLSRVTGIALLAVPVQHQRAILARLPPGLAPLVACAKGVEAASHLLPLEVVESVHPGTPAAVLTGPNFAHEIAAGLPAAAVVAATQATLRNQIIAALSTPAFRLYGNDDPVGAQVGGAAKNVIAIAAGTVIGAGLGENARAALITRGLAELARLAVALGGRAETVMGLSGLGDLLLTCTGPASRNYSLGLALGRGEKLADLLAASGAVIEGVATAPALIARAAASGSPDQLRRRSGTGVDVPICTAVAALLDGRTTLQQAVADLLARPLRDE